MHNKVETRVLYHSRNIQSPLSIKRASTLLLSLQCQHFPLGKAVLLAPHIFLVNHINISHDLCFATLEKELSLTVKGSFEGTQDIVLGPNGVVSPSCPTEFHYIKYAEPTLDVMLPKKRHYHPVCWRGLSDGGILSVSQESGRKERGSNHYWSCPKACCFPSGPVGTVQRRAPQS